MDTPFGRGRKNDRPNEGGEGGEPPEQTAPGEERDWERYSFSELDLLHMEFDGIEAVLEQKRREAQEAEEKERTDKPDDRPVVWDELNRKHIGEDHPDRGISVEEVDQALQHPERREKYDLRRDNYVALASTEAGRILRVAWVEHPKGRYPIHALEATAKLIKRWEKL